MSSRTAFPVLVIASSMLGGCETIGSIFKAGAWTGVILVLVVLAIGGGIAMLFRK
ncbi:MAG: hypothetical protein WKG00_06405 [Polyangiaceae bacterium]